MLLGLDGMCQVGTDGLDGLGGLDVGHDKGAGSVGVWLEEGVVLEFVLVE